MAEKQDDSNTRIFGILSIVFFFVPIVSIVLGVIATQKGRKLKSDFAIKAGFAGIAISALVLLSGGYMGYKLYEQSVKDANKANYSSCIETVKAETPKASSTKYSSDSFFSPEELNAFKRNFQESQNCKTKYPY